LAAKSNDEKQVPPSPDSAVDDVATLCGLIMPISSTEHHDEKHWAAVQTLLHRGIRAAGLTPANVWEGVNDRISKRIVSNIFKQDIVVADISDLNPNVMLELGLRLASKKPTVVVFNKGGRIPFDITDVEALPYPGDLNILEMEIFFEKFSKTLSDRLSAFKAGAYEPFLADVVVEVLEPQTKEVSFERLILERLDEIGTRLARVERPGRVGGEQRLQVGLSKRSGSTTFVTVPEAAGEEFAALLEKVSPYHSKYVSDGKAYFAVGHPTDESSNAFRTRLQNALNLVSGSVGVPEDATEILRLIG
jgi:hypothetical protein